jgi:hypothetical protein
LLNLNIIVPCEFKQAVQANTSKSEGMRSVIFNINIENFIKTFFPESRNINFFSIGKNLRKLVINRYLMYQLNNLRLDRNKNIIIQSNDILKEIVKSMSIALNHKSERLDKTMRAYVDHRIIFKFFENNYSLDVYNTCDIYNPKIIKPEWAVDKQIYDRVDYGPINNCPILPDQLFILNFDFDNLIEKELIEIVKMEGSKDEFKCIACFIQLKTKDGIINHANTKCIDSFIKYNKKNNLICFDVFLQKYKALKEIVNIHLETSAADNQLIQNTQIIVGNENSQLFCENNDTFLNKINSTNKPNTIFSTLKLNPENDLPFFDEWIKFCGFDNSMINQKFYPYIKNNLSIEIKPKHKHYLNNSYIGIIIGILEIKSVGTKSYVFSFLMSDSVNNSIIVELWSNQKENLLKDYDQMQLFMYVTCNGGYLVCKNESYDSYFKSSCPNILRLSIDLPHNSIQLKGLEKPNSLSIIHLPIGSVVYNLSEIIEKKFENQHDFEFSICFKIHGFGMPYDLPKRPNYNREPKAISINIYDETNLNFIINIFEEKIYESLHIQFKVNPDTIFQLSFLQLNKKQSGDNRIDYLSTNSSTLLTIFPINNRCFELYCQLRKSMAHVLDDSQ